MWTWGYTCHCKRIANSQFNTAVDELTFTIMLTNVRTVANPYLSACLTVLDFDTDLKTVMWVARPTKVEHLIP
eukprot:295364-Amphidinium_carterae.1